MGLGASLSRSDSGESNQSLGSGSLGLSGLPSVGAARARTGAAPFRRSAPTAELLTLARKQEQSANDPFLSASHAAI